jgi:hypothetical protein
MRALSRVTHLAGIAGLVAALGLVAPARAQSSDSVTVDPDTFGTTGRIAVNAAAGVLNQQANAAVLGQSETFVLMSNIVSQSLVANGVCTLADGECGSAPAQATINGFEGANGLIEVNAAAGVENQQANLAVFGISAGIDGRIVSLTLLSQVRATEEPAGGPIAPVADKTADFGPHAFQDASGLVQANSTAGVGNSSANIFALAITGGTD